MPILCTDDYRALARPRLPADVWDYLDGGSGAELTLGANRRLFDRAELRPRVLVDVSVCDTAGKLLGDALTTPVGIAPTAYHRLAHPDGEVATARGARGALFVVSIFASRSLEDIAAAATGPLWLQLYWLRRRAVLAELARRAQDAGYRALVLTVDAPRIGQRLRDQRNGFAVDPEVRAVNLDDAIMAASHEHHEGASAIATHAAQTFDQTVTWADLAWLRGRTELPLVLKGVLTAEDADRAVEHGVDAIVVSNHGGRQLDGAVPALRALPEVVAAVAGRCPVLLDGGVRHGRDVFIALALGASAVLVGRPALWALAVDGADGVAGLLTMLTGELEHTMALAGRPRLADIGRDAVLLPDRRD
ncbi:alpha-hydroxy acid oxidase [Catellatospora coxensis]|uniref:Alpha-hydroxy-acid oxidizing enzyme n=1 Tax=Catellatospora coxensis TaxID=310354 RepID=A0A8J3L2R0_9ACTN|nr:alpha-hydroxy acid oxidase [Catellatospora coxensis]GIG07929.1 alpha-hydroxy-acid oxidizing enzyme [Catellatospora coxensis]